MEKLFKLNQNKTTVKTELYAGFTTFFTMCYIIFVNPEVLGSTGINPGAVMIATCIAAAIGSLLSGLLSNYPLAQAPGMGLNAFFAYTICGTMGYSWRAALAAVLISGLFFIAITATGLRSILITAIPDSLRRAIGAGIGLFIAFIGLTNAGIIAAPPGGSPIVGFGNLGNPSVLLSIFCLVLVSALLCLRIKGSLLIAIITTSVIGAILQFGLGIPLGLTAPDFSLGLSESFSAFGDTFGACFSGFAELFDNREGLGAMLASVASILIALTLTDMFDTLGMLVGTAELAGFLDKDGNLPRADRALLADAIATAAGAVLGTSTVTTYAESTAGVNAGGKTGLTSAVVSILFLASLVLAPVLGLIPTAATAPILIVVGVSMVSGLKSIEWGDIAIALPCFFTVVMMPFTYSIADGVGLGFIFYTIVKMFTGKRKEVHPAILLFSVIFILRYVLMATGKI